MSRDVCVGKWHKHGSLVLRGSGGSTYLINTWPSHHKLRKIQKPSLYTSDSFPLIFYWIATSYLQLHTVQLHHTFLACIYIFLYVLICIYYFSLLFLFMYCAVKKNVFLLYWYRQKTSQDGLNFQFLECSDELMFECSYNERASMNLSEWHRCILLKWIAK